MPRDATVRAAIGGGAHQVTKAEVVAAIRRSHLKANIDQFEKEKTATVHWNRAWIDPGGTIFGPGPYLKVPVTSKAFGGSTLCRVYAPARLQRRLAAAWKYRGYRGRVLKVERVK